MTDTLLVAAPDTPSVSGDGVSLTLSDGKPHTLRFSAKAIIRVENAWGSHEAFMLALEQSPVATLASLLIIAADAKGDDEAIDLLDGIDWHPVRDAVDAAWRKANWMPETNAVPTTGS